MAELTTLFALVVALVAVIALIAAWAPRVFWVKAVAVLVTLLFIPIAYAAMGTLLSQPKPVALEWWHRQAEEATLLAAVMREGKGIDVWLQLPGQDKPGAYTLPWSNEMAQQIQEAQREAQKGGEQGTVKLKLPFERSWDQLEPKAYALPQPKLPDKEGQEPPQEYVAPGSDA